MLNLYIHFVTGLLLRIALHGGCSHPTCKCCMQTSHLKCPDNTHSVERKNRDANDNVPVLIRQGLISFYKLDKSYCAKHIASQEFIHKQEQSILIGVYIELLGNDIAGRDVEICHIDHKLLLFNHYTKSNTMESCQKDGIAIKVQH